MKTTVLYCWYAYYIPIIFIPLFVVFIIDYIGKPENYVASRWMKLLYIPALALVFAVFTNDFHQMVFDFPNEIKYFDIDYSYGVLYFIIMTWVVVLAIYCIVRLMLKCRVPGSRAFRWMPAIVFVGAVLFWVLYGMGIIRCDMTAVNCLIITLLLESTIQSGLIRSNSRYSSLFSASTIKSQIADCDYNICYASKESKYFDKTTLMQAKQGAVTVDNYRLNSAEITGGYVFWLDDISKITQLTQNLQLIGKRLSEKNSLVRAELELKEKRARVEEQTRIYDRVTNEMTKQLDELNNLLQQAESNPDNMKIILPRICVLSAYVKRKGNLLLIGEGNSLILAKEIEYCIRESADNLQLNDVITAFDSDCKGDIPVNYAVAVYDIFEALLEDNLSSVNALIINLKVSDGELSLILGIGSEGINTPDCSVIESLGGKVAFESDDTDTSVQIRIPKGGVQE